MPGTYKEELSRRLETYKRLYGDIPEKYAGWNKTEIFNTEFVQYDTPEEFYADTDLFVLEGLDKPYIDSRLHEGMVIRNRLLDLIGSDLTIADVGGGTGIQSWALSEIASSIDLVEAEGSKTHEYNKELWKDDDKIHPLSWEEFLASDKHYDVVVAIDFFEHFPEPEGIIETMLKKGTHLVEKSWFGNDSYLMHFKTDYSIPKLLSPRYKKEDIDRNLFAWIRKDTTDKK